MTESERLEYKTARRIGDRRFGSPCRHERTHGSRCLNCLRRVRLRRSQGRSCPCGYQVFGRWPEKGSSARRRLGRTASVFLGGTKQATW